MRHYSLLICCFSVLTLAHSVFSYADNCKKFDLHPKPVEILPNHPYGLWPGLTNKIDLENGETLPGFHEVTCAVEFVLFDFILFLSFSKGDRGHLEEPTPTRLQESQISDR
jgi:hypothetical protein